MADFLLQRLESGCSQLGLSLPPARLQLLCRYVELLDKWNRVYNLTAVRQPRDMISYHLLDSLVLVPWLDCRRLLDVGTGAGLPGIPLAIACPDKSFSLLDSNGKKIRFLRQAIAELGLENVEPIQRRAQHLVDKAGFDMVLSRAFASLADMTTQTDHLLADEGRWLAMKGIYPAAELDDLPAGVMLQAVEPLEVPFLEAERHLVILRRRDSGGVSRELQI